MVIVLIVSITPHDGFVRRVVICFSRLVVSISQASYTSRGLTATSLPPLFAVNLRLGNTTLDSGEEMGTRTFSDSLIILEMNK
jgi:hypothetical protein